MTVFLSHFVRNRLLDYLLLLLSKLITIWKTPPISSPLRGEEIGEGDGRRLIYVD